MHSIKGEHSHATIIERWQAVDEYFVCISECDLNDQVCTTRCVLTHLKADDDEPMTDVTIAWYIPSAQTALWDCLGLLIQSSEVSFRWPGRLAKASQSVGLRWSVIQCLHHCGEVCWYSFHRHAIDLQRNSSGGFAATSSTLARREVVMASWLPVIPVFLKAHLMTDVTFWVTWSVNAKRTPAHTYV